MSGDKNSLWNKEKYLCLMKNPFTVCCGISYLNSNMRNPPDAEKLSDDEAKFYIDNLKGSWTITVLEHPDMGVLYNQGFSHVLISKEKMSFSGGPKGRKHDVTLSLHRTPEGVIYLDEKGSELTKFDPRNGVIETLSFHGFKCMLKRDGDLAVTNQPCW